MKKNIKKIVTLGLTLALSAQGVAALASDADVQKVVVAHTNYYVPYDFEDEEYLTEDVADFEAEVK